jgi:uncharacterized protein YbaA (DUF1428 family)
MYVCGLVIPVPEENIDAYRLWSKNGAEIFKRYGCLEIVESWEDFVPNGKQTDFRRAVAAKEGEKIVFTWQVWPDKETFFAAEDRMHADNALDLPEGVSPPFEASRLIFGCFQPIHSIGRE